jgi:hypothetical protein
VKVILVTSSASTLLPLILDNCQDPSNFLTALWSLLQLATTNINNMVDNKNTFLIISVFLAKVLKISKL